MGVVPLVREELSDLVHTTSTVTPSTVSSPKVMEQVRVRLEAIKAGEDDTSTITGVLTMDQKKNHHSNVY